MGLTDKALTDEELEELQAETRQAKKVASGVVELQAIKDAQKPALREIEELRAEHLELVPIGADLIATMESIRPFRSSNVQLNRTLEEHFYAELKRQVNFGEGNMDAVHEYVNTLSKSLLRDIEASGSVAASVQERVRNCRARVEEFRNTIEGCKRHLRDYKTIPRHGIGEPSWEAQEGERPRPDNPQYTGKVLTNVEGNERGID